MVKAADMFYGHNRKYIDNRIKAVTRKEGMR